jgi:aryl-alcohol dehydrogenase-like predicted oxidoreductase
VRYIGASSGWAWQLATALGLSDRNGWARFVSMQNHYNLIYREEEREVIPLCREEGLGVIPWSPLARGHLARPAADYREPVTNRAANDEYGKRLYDGPGDREIIGAVEAVAEARSASMAEVALAWLLSKPVVTAPIIGATKMDHLDAAVRAVDLELTEDEVERLEAPYRPHRIMGH